jgi:hypothetical protein
VVINGVRIKKYLNERNLLSTIPVVAVFMMSEFRRGELESGRFFDRHIPSEN